MTFKGSCQLSDLARIDYTNIPKGNSSVEYNQVRALFNYPIRLNEKSSYLFLGLDYSNINLFLDDNESSINKDEIDGFQLLDLNIGYTKLLKNNWRLGIRFTPGLSSNLTAKDLSLDDIILSSNVVFIKDNKKDAKIDNPWRLIIGISYSGNRGFPFPLPFISYYKKLNDRWSYNFGIPKSNIQYHFSNKHRLKGYTQLDGFTSNLQRGVSIDNSSTAQSINMSLILSGLQYEYHLTNHIEFYIKAAYILSNSFQLRDKNRNNIFELDNSNNLYLKTGLQLKI